MTRCKTGPGIGAQTGHASRGFVLLPVAVLLAMLAALAWLMNHDSVAVAGRVQGAGQGHTARYVAEAAMQHARWIADAAGCTGYALPVTAFGEHSYSAQFNPADGSPVTIAATGTLDNGVTRELQRSGVRVYQAPQTLALQPDAATGKDTWLYKWKSTWNYGLSPDVYVSNEFADSLSNGLLQFDLSAVPAGATVLGATLELRQNMPSSSGGSVTAHAVSSDWVEGIKTGGVGTPNWTQADAGMPWASAGGDFAAAAAATVTLAPGVLGWFSWDVTALVGEWVSGARINRGLALVPAAPGTDVTFDSSDSTTALDRPRLTVVYACECGIVCGSAPAPAGNLLMVVADDTALTAAGQVKKTVIEGFGYTVTLIGALSGADALRTAALANDVIFVADRADLLDTKLAGVHLGVVNEDEKLPLQFGIWEKSKSLVAASAINVTDNSHYITQEFATGSLSVFSTPAPMANLDGVIAGGATVLATSAGDAAVAALDKGADRYPASTAPGRRVQLPWGKDYDPAEWSADAVTLLKRSLEWAAQVPDVTSAAYLDRFESATCVAATEYSHSDGVLDWSSAAWTEIDDGTPCGGNVQIGSDGGDDALYINRTGRSISRAVNLDGATFATLFLEFRRESLDDASDVLRIEASADGGGAWVEIARIEGPATDASYQSLSVDLMAYAGTNTVIRLLGDGLENTGSSPDRVWIDDLRIETDSAGGPVGGSCTSYLLDDFETVSYANQAGTVNWAADWSETGESDGPGTGDLRIESFGGSLALRIGGPGPDARRGGDLSAYSSAILSYDYRRDGLNAGNEFVRVGASNNGGGSWTELIRHSGPGSDAVWQSASFDISAYISNQTMLAFKSSNASETDDHVYFDNVKICVQ